MQPPSVAACQQHAGRRRGSAGNHLQSFGRHSSVGAWPDGAPMRIESPRSSPSVTLEDDDLVAGLAVPASFWA